MWRKSWMRTFGKRVAARALCSRWLMEGPFVGLPVGARKISRRDVSSSSHLLPAAVHSAACCSRWRSRTSRAVPVRRSVRRLALVFSSVKTYWPSERRS